MGTGMGTVSEGWFSTGVPYLRWGQGPPLLVASGLTPHHANPTGARRRLSLTWMTPFAEHFTVYLVNRRAGLAPGTTMAEIAADYAGAIEHDIGQPVLLHGTSAGGTMSLQLAMDRPELVERLVLGAAACRLSRQGRQLMVEVSRLAKEGGERRASALMFEALAPRPLGYAARGVGWTMGGGFAADKVSDMVVTIDAENGFDAEPTLDRVQAPALVLGGTADVFYSTDLFRRTAAGMANGTAVIFPGKSHGHVGGSKVAAGIALGFLLGR